MRSLLFALGLAACSPSVGPEGVQVGRICSADRDCAVHCLLDDDRFSGGYCTATCMDDNGCPSGSICIAQKNGPQNATLGWCIASCQSASDCNTFGRGWVCDNVDRFPASAGQGKVCRLP
jgi:hypothetical protein